jgi:hypothetical protein
MAYTKTTWVDRVVQNPLTYTMRNNADGTVTLIPAEGTIVQSGTPITASVMNNLETQYEKIVALAQMTKLTADTGFIQVVSVDVDTVFTSGFYYAGSAARAVSPNLPTTANMMLIVYQFSANTAMQIAYEMGTFQPREWKRYASNGTWGAWVPAASQDWVKSLGIGGFSVPLPSPDLNTQTTNGLYYCTGTITNGIQGANGFLTVEAQTATVVKQTYLVFSTGNLYYRLNQSGTWGTWTQLATTTQEAWTNLTLVNSWVSYGGTFATPGYRKNNFGEVELRGMVKSGVTTNGTVIATLPAGYRPTSDKVYSVICNNGTADVIGYISISTGGSIIFKSGANTYLSLDSIPPIPTT